MSPCVVGTTIYFASDNGPGHFGKSDIYYATYSGNNKWTNKTNVGSGVNTSNDEYCPWVVGNYMYYTYATGNPPCYLYVSEYSGGSWQKGIQLPGYSPSGNDFNPSVPSSNDILYFASTYGSPNYGLYDIYYITKTGSNWGGKTNVGTQINTSTYEATPGITPDGNTLFFARMVNNKFHIFRATGNHSSWSNVEELPDPVNLSGYTSYCPCYISSDRKLYFCSDRPGGSGGMDLYVARDRSAIEPTSLGVLKAVFH